jgi:tetratricopeptide (TPR) repeat protein
MEESADAYGRAAALDSTVQLFEINNVMGAFRAGRQEEGQHLAARFASRDTTSAYRYAVHAEMMVQLRDPDAAIASAERSIRLDEDLLAGYMQLGIARMLKEDGPGADSAFVAGLARDSTAARLWVARGILHNALEKHDLALQYWERARALAPRLLTEPNVEPHYRAALAAAKEAGLEVPEP